jgi:hypothetical protein
VSVVKGAFMAGEWRAAAWWLERRRPETYREDSSDECDCGHFVTTFGKTGSKTCKNRQVSSSVLMAVKSLITMEVHIVQ